MITLLLIMYSLHDLTNILIKNEINPDYLDQIFNNSSNYSFNANQYENANLLSKHGIENHQNLKVFIYILFYFIER